jgi:ASC-1-like (ASCH) protein
LVAVRGEEKKIMKGRTAMFNEKTNLRKLKFVVESIKKMATFARMVRKEKVMVKVYKR